MSNIIGLDIGGAHLKVAQSKNGKITDVRQILCPLWKGLHHLDDALRDVKSMTANTSRIAVTMTGELSDLFETRQQGVKTIVDRAQNEFGTRPIYWMGQRGFGDQAEALKYFDDVGSTNFLATAYCVAKNNPHALLIDMGSTTTDIIPIIDGQPAAEGLTDPERLITGELVYTGFTRTAVMAITNRVPFKNQWQTMAREYLATMADVYRILGTLHDADDLHDTADGRGKSRAESTARLARMLGREAADATDEEWHKFAAHLADVQLQSIKDGCTQVISRHETQRPTMLVRAGIGERALIPLAQSFNMQTTTFGEHVTQDPDLAQKATACAPAVAMALLAQNPPPSV